MGCCFSGLKSGAGKKSKQQQQQEQKPQQPRVKRSFARQPSDLNGIGVPAFSEFTLAELKAATDGFSSENVLSESGDKAPNVVYKGQLKNKRLIAVKKFNKNAWPDHKQFAVESLVLLQSINSVLFVSFKFPDFKLFCFDFNNRRKHGELGS